MDIIAEAGIKGWKQLRESAQECAEYIYLSDPTMESILRNVGGIPEFDPDTMEFLPPDDDRQYSVYTVHTSSPPLEFALMESPAFPEVPTRPKVFVGQAEILKQKQFEDITRHIADYILRKFPDIKNFKSLLSDVSEEGRVRQLRRDVEQGLARQKEYLINVEGYSGEIPSVGEIMLSVNDKVRGLYVHEMRITGENYLANMFRPSHAPLHAYSAPLQDKLSNSYPEDPLEAPFSLTVRFNGRVDVEEVVFVNGLTSQVVKNTYPASVTNNKQYIQSRVNKIASKIEKAIGPEAALQMYEDGEDTPDVWMYFLAWLLTSDQTLPQKLLWAMVEQTPVMQVKDLTELAHEDERYVYSDEFAETLIDTILEEAGFDDFTESEQEDLGEMIYERAVEELISNTADDIERVKYSSWLVQSRLPSDKIDKREQGEDIVNAIMDLVTEFKPPVVEIDFGKSMGVDVGWAFSVNPYYLKILCRPDLLDSKFTGQEERISRPLNFHEAPLKL
jgi:hypothetical protein